MRLLRLISITLLLCAVSVSVKAQVTGDTVVLSDDMTHTTWKPSPKKAMWLAFIPGAGQIYNRKYWKLPIVYGAFTGCAYAIRWNNMMYSDYRQAFKDITDDDPTTDSYNKFLHLGTEVTPDNADRYTELFRKRKDFYRRYRDLSIIITAAVYALSIIDAYVDASLSDFDISRDLSMRITPTIINNNPPLAGNVTHTTPLQLHSKALGIACTLNF